MVGQRSARMCNNVVTGDRVSNLYVRASMWLFARIIQLSIRSLLDAISCAHLDGHWNTNLFGWQNGMCRFRAVDSRSLVFLDILGFGIADRYFVVDCRKEGMLHPYRIAIRTLKTSGPLLSEMFDLRIFVVIREMQIADEHVLQYDLIAMTPKIYDADMITGNRCPDVSSASEDQTFSSPQRIRQSVSCERTLTFQTIFRHTIRMY
ncbi:hypothetical protein CLF_108484 [Clonorchis sinensis]|uniref:Uncharacterized protein n=1 Tax=Clonorchis sinensis TaxID=79923 RepID=G7YRN2_CLOSI|nr:hypothetical protein CLF_108484 [Clonorchis sinensis]